MIGKSLTWYAYDQHTDVMWCPLQLKWELWINVVSLAACCQCFGGSIIPYRNRHNMGEKVCEEFEFISWIISRGRLILHGQHIWWVRLHYGNLAYPWRFGGAFRWFWSLSEGVRRFPLTSIPLPQAGEPRVPYLTKLMIANIHLLTNELHSL